MLQTTEFMDVADTDFLGNKENDYDDINDSEFDSDFEKYLVLSATRNRLVGRKRPLHAVLGSGKSNASSRFITWFASLIHLAFCIEFELGRKTPSLFELEYNSSILFTFSTTVLQSYVKHIQFITNI